MCYFCIISDIFWINLHNWINKQIKHNHIFNHIPFSFELLYNMDNTNQPRNLWAFYPLKFLKFKFDSKLRCFYIICLLWFLCSILSLSSGREHKKGTECIDKCHIMGFDQLLEMLCKQNILGKEMPSNILSGFHNS